VVELLLDIVAWSLQKVQVALGFDAPVDTQELTLLDFAEDGHTVIAHPTG